MGRLHSRPSLCASALGRDTAVARRERELLQREVVALSERSGVDATVPEMMIVSNWAWSAAYEWLRHHDQWLSVLLDGIDEAAAVFSTDGRICTPTANAGLPARGDRCLPDEIVARTGAELGAPAELGAGLPPDQLGARARTNASEETSLLGRWRERGFGEIYAPDGSLGAVTLGSPPTRDTRCRRRSSTRSIAQASAPRAHAIARPTVWMRTRGVT